MNDERKPQPKFLVYHESLRDSVISDVVSLSLLTFCFSFNHLFVGSTFLNGILLILFALGAVRSVFSKSKRFYSKEELIDYLLSEGGDHG